MKDAKNILVAISMIGLLTTGSLQKIFVISPSSLKKKIKIQDHTKGHIDYSISTFGYLDYQAKSHMIVKQWTSENGCEQPGSSLMNEENRNIAFIMRRGECSFFQKAKNVQMAGGKLAIVVLDNNDDPENDIPVGPVDAKAESMDIPPVIVIRKRDGDLILEYLGKNSKVKLHVDFDIRQWSGTLRVKVWANYAEKLSYTFLADFMDDYDIYKDKVDLKLVEFVRNKSYYLIEEKADADKHCLLNGKYCASPLKTADLSDPKESLIEGVRFNCIFNNLKAKAKQEDSQFTQFSLYLRAVANFCFSRPPPIELSLCARELRGNYEFMPEDDLEKCKEKALVVDEYDEEDTRIVYMEQMRKMSSFYDFNSVPAVFVNEHLVRGEIKGEIAAGAICDSMKKPTEGCRTLHQAVMEKVKTMNKNLFNGPRISNPIILFFSIIVLIVLIILIAKRSLSHDIELEIGYRAEQIISDYHKISEMGEQDGKVRTVEAFHEEY